MAVYQHINFYFQQENDMKKQISDHYIIYLNVY